jgi:serine/threonine protein kinase
MDKYIGKKLDGRYEIQEIIGVGGMAIVYKAYDSIDDRSVAVKILKEEFLSNEEFKRRFKNESKAIAVLSHPNIVKVFDVSLSDRLQYIVMEYIDGITLKEYIDQQKLLKWKEAVHFTVQILRAMQHAHEKGIVHRDIKPQNIMLLQDGTIKVTDFGIARFSRSETRTITDKAIGSVHYISPEQARGGFIDEKADIYSVGVMLYEMLTGQLPFEADSPVSVAIMQLQSDPKHLREINETIPEGLEDITLRAMQKDPAARYQSAAEMLKDIEEFKKNPSVHFEYKYFVDDNPTKFVDAINQVKNPEGVEEETEKKSSLIPILSGVAAAFVLVVLIGVFIVLIQAGILFPSSGPSVPTPNLVGQNINDVLLKYNKDFKIVVETHQDNKDYAKDLIISQNPTSAITSKKNGTIKVIVSNGPPIVQVTDVYAQEASLATAMLQNAGFTVTQQKMYDSSTPLGYVVKTSPSRFTNVALNSTVVLMVSGPQPSGGNVQVKDYTNKLIDDVVAGLTNDKLTLGPKTEKADASPKGTILAQSFTAGSNVPELSPINFTVSTGVPPEKSATITIDLTKFSDIGDSVTVSIFNSDTGNSISSGDFLTTIASKTFTLTGNGVVNYTVNINGKYYRPYTVDYNQSPPSISAGEENFSSPSNDSSQYTSSSKKNH